LRLAKEDRERRDATRAAAWSTQARGAETAKELGRNGTKMPPKGSLADRAKYQFEADSEDEYVTQLYLRRRLFILRANKLFCSENISRVTLITCVNREMENEIDNNVDLLHGAAGRLGNLARAMGQEVDSQNKHIERIGGKVDKVDDEIALNRNRLDRIH
jgi:hypothetical protein